MTESDDPRDELDLSELAATDALLDSVAQRSPQTDPMGAELVAWLDAIDDGYVSAEPAGAEVVDLRSVRRLRGRAIAAVAVLGVASLAGAGVAAASPGSPLYPVHRVVFPHSHPHTSVIPSPRSRRHPR